MTAPIRRPAVFGLGEQPRAPFVGVLRWEHESPVATLLAQAFLDDPLVAAICDAPTVERRRRMRWSFRIAVRSHCLAAQPGWIIAGSAATPAGVVLVTRPRAEVQSRSDWIFLLRGLTRIGTRTVLRGVRAAQTIATHAPPQPFTYLRTLGVDPQMQGQGLGSALVQQVIRTAVPTLPLYLETAKEANLAFYARHGFDCIGEFRCLDVPVWRLIRRAEL